LFVAARCRLGSLFVFPTPRVDTIQSSVAASHRRRLESSIFPDLFFAPARVPTSVKNLVVPPLCAPFLSPVCCPFLGSAPNRPLRDYQLELHLP
jgi:hypothetical protein